MMTDGKKKDKKTLPSRDGLKVGWAHGQWVKCPLPANKVIIHLSLYILATLESFTYFPTVPILAGQFHELDHKKGRS